MKQFYCSNCKIVFSDVEYCPYCDFENYISAIIQIRDEEDLKKKLEEERIAAEIAEDIRLLDLSKYRLINLLQHVQNGRVSCAAASDLILKLIEI